MPMICDDAWRRRCATSPFRDVVIFDGDDLVLGHGTILCKVEPIKSAAISLRSDREHDRMIALLAVAGGGRLAKTALAQLTAAVNDWRSGARALAAIRLAFARLPSLRDHRDAYRLFLAETALDAGLSPRQLVDELSYGDCAALLKFDPNQPRVPAASGAASGRWTSDSGPGSASGGAQGPRPIPVFQQSEPDEKDVPDLKETERQFGLPAPDAERSGQRLHLPDIPLGGPSGLAKPGRAPSTAPEPGSAKSPLPFGSHGSMSSNSDKNKEGPACPEQEDDIARGANPSADLFEYIMSIIVNPDLPTPKNSPLTPNVTSQAYFLPSLSASGRTSFDDCKKTNVPTLAPIPGLRPGDMVEYKSPGWGWIIFNNWTSGYTDFANQVKNQDKAVSLEGKGRQIFYCMGNLATANEAERLYGSRYASSHFLVCH